MSVHASCMDSHAENGIIHTHQQGGIEREEIEESNTKDIQELQTKLYALWASVSQSQSQSQPQPQSQSQSQSQAETFQNLAAVVEGRIDLLRRYFHG